MIASVLILAIGVAAWFYVQNQRKIQAEAQRQNMMVHLQEKYAHYGLNFYNNDTISIEQMLAIDDVLDNMQAVAYF